jgi:hypothetical protein
MFARVNRFVLFEDISVAIATPPRAVRPGNRGSVLVRGKRWRLKASGSALAPTQASVQSVLSASSLGERNRCAKPFTHLHLVSKLRMNGAVPVRLLYRLPICLGQGRIFLLPIPKNYLVHAIFFSDSDSVWNIIHIRNPTRCNSVSKFYFLFI